MLGSVCITLPPASIGSVRDGFGVAKLCELSFQRLERRRSFLSFCFVWQFFLVVSGFLNGSLKIAPGDARVVIHAVLQRIKTSLVTDSHALRGDAVTGLPCCLRRFGFDPHLNQRGRMPHTCDF